MAEAKMPHPGHDKHLCYLNNLGFPATNRDEYKELVRNGKFFCKGCGRVAVREQNLCAPLNLD